MRGSLSYNELFHVISVEDKEILQNIIKDNIETTNKTGLPLIWSVLSYCSDTNSSNTVL